MGLLEPIRQFCGTRRRERSGQEEEKEFRSSAPNRSQNLHHPPPSLQGFSFPRIPRKIKEQQGHGLQLCQGRLRLESSRNSLMERVAKGGKGGLECPSLKVPQEFLEVALRAPVGLGTRGWEGFPKPH